jgi:hypothetical protein
MLLVQATTLTAYPSSAKSKARTLLLGKKVTASDLQPSPLDNPGGDFTISSLIIGATILERNFSTALFDASICASGCTCSTSRIGFHMAYDKNTGQAAGTENATVGSSLTKPWPQYNAKLAYCC